MSAVIASSAAAMAAAAASRARTEACKAVITTFETEGASVAEMKQYAGCVQRIYPDDMSDQSAMWVKGAILLVFAAMVVGAWRMRKYGWLDGIVLGALAGLVASVLGGVFLFVAVIAIRFLLT